VCTIGGYVGSVSENSAFAPLAEFELVVRSIPHDQPNEFGRPTAKNHANGGFGREQDAEAWRVVDLISSLGHVFILA
jgi:hypothetical protein